MTGSHRNPRPSLLERIGERLSHVGDRKIRAVGGDITHPKWTFEPPPGPIVLDHSHRLDDRGACRDIRCEYDASHDPATQTVIDVPAGEPEFRNAYGPVR